MLPRARGAAATSRLRLRNGRARRSKKQMVDYSKWDTFEDSDDERIAEDLRGVQAAGDARAAPAGKESARRIARAFMSQEDETTGPECRETTQQTRT